jgi:serine/threonine-protein kinase
MAPVDGTDPSAATPIPLDGDGSELIGTVIDARYRLDSTLGRGGMGLVYRATHLGMRRQVAVKILHPSLAASPEVRNRFEREALAVGKIDHPNCVATYDVGRLPDGALYLAMELLEGHSLADVLEDERQIAPGRALHILAHILRGLGAVHAAGLIHRDIKPENIFLIRHGDDLDFAKILDFGIAKPMAGELSDDGVRLTQAGMAFGTPIYMAPEQALGNKMDGRADLYAAAVIGYEMLVGQPPFYSDDKLEVMSMHTAKPVPPMRARLVRGAKPVPSSLEKLIVRGLTKKPGDRYASAEIFLAAVEQALETPEGGQTDILFERPAQDTGSQPLVSDDGRVSITGESPLSSEEDPFGSIASDIDEAINLAPTGAKLKPYVPQRTETPGRGVGSRDAAAKIEPIPGTPASARVGTRLGVEPATPTAPVQPPIVAPGGPRGRPAPAGGGVGLGLPYPGPQGEPIFGLTPEQRLAQVPRKKAKRWPLYAGIAGAAVVAGITIAIVTAPRGDPDKLDPATPAGAAAEALDRGDATHALQLLDQHKAELKSDPDGQLVYGHTYAALKKTDDALQAYANALGIAPDVETDNKLRANLRFFAGQKDPELVRKAFDLWAGHTKDTDAIAALANAAISQDLDRRHAVYPVIEKYHFGDSAHVDFAAAYVLDLEQEKTCELRKDAVKRLRTLSDPKAIPNLEQAVERRIHDKGPQFNKPANACLITEAKETIGYLRGVKPKAKP